MPKRFDPAEIEALGGPPPEKLRDWRHRGLLEGIGELRSGRWGYSMDDVLILGCAGLLVDNGMEIAPALELTKGGRGLLFAWLFHGTPHDNFMLANHREQEEVVFVVPDHKSRSGYSAKCWAWELLQSSDDFRYVIQIFPRVLISDLDKRFRKAILEEYASINEEIRGKR